MTKKERITIVLVCFIFMFAGFLLGEIIYDSPVKCKTNNIEEIDNQMSNKIDNESNETTMEENEPIVNNDSNIESESGLSSSCKSMMEKLNFSNDTKDFYCYSDLCYKDVNELISTIKYDINDNIKINTEYPNNDLSETFLINDIYNLKLTNGKVKVIKNGEVSNKTTLSGVNNIESFRATFSVSDGNLLYILSSDKNVYEYKVDEEWTKATNKRLVYKDVKDFDIFEGNDYKECVGGGEGQSIQIALHTNSGKTYFGNTFE